MIGVSSTPGPGQMQAKSFYCVFCKDIVSLRMGDISGFQSHMETVHRVFYEFDILLAVNFIDRKEKDEIINKVKAKIEGGEEEKRLVMKPKMMTKNDSFKEPSSKVKIEKIPSHIGKPLNKEFLPKKTTIKKEPVWNDISVEPVSVGIEPNVNNIPNENQRLKSLNNVQITPIIAGNSTTPVTAVNIVEVKKEPKEYVEEKNPLEIDRKKREYPCLKCGKNFGNKFMLNKHEAKKFNCERTCRICGMEFKVPGDLRTHKEKYKDTCKRIKQTPKPQDLSKISEVPKVLEADKEKVPKQQISNIKVREYISSKCKDCLKIFYSKQAARAHDGNKDMVCVERFECKKCGRKLKKEKYEFHIKKNCVLLPSCKDCGEKFTKVALSKHEKRRRCVAGNNKCEVCNNVFNEFKTLKRHMRREHKQKSFSCKGCNKTFSGERFVRAHIKQKKDCPAFNPIPDIEKSSFDKSDKEDINSMETLSENVAEPPKKKIKTEITSQTSDEVINERVVCEGCNKEVKNQRYLLVHQGRKKDCPAFKPELIKSGASHDEV